MRSLHTIIDAFLKNMEMKNQVGLAQTIFTHFSCPSQHDPETLERLKPQKTGHGHYLF